MQLWCAIIEQMAKEVRKFCDHCEETLAPRTFREHARLYYDARSHIWTKKRKIGDPDELSLDTAEVQVK